MPMFACMARSEEMLAAVLRPFDRSTEEASQVRHDDLLRVELGLHAEAATYVGGHNANPVFRDIEAVG
jgi:hypothetical protein